MQWGDHKFVRVFVADRSYQDNGQSQPHEVEDSAKYIHIMQSSSNQITGILEQITKLQTPTALQFTEQAGDVHPSSLPGYISLRIVPTVGLYSCLIFLIPA